MKTTFITIIALLSFNLLLVAADPISASNVRWIGPLGLSNAAPNSMFCLMAWGFFQMEKSPDMPGLIAAWLRDHPKAIVVPVATVQTPTYKPPATSKHPDHKEPDSKIITFIWIVDGEHNLNLELVRQGCFEPQTQTIVEGQKLETSQTEYDAFVQKVMGAGKEAEEKKLGVWKASAE